MLWDQSSPSSAIKEFLDVRRVKRRFDYFVDFANQPPTERAWVPLSDIPTTYNESLERFHRRNPRLPCPANSTLLRTQPLFPASTSHTPVSHPADVPAEIPTAADATTMDTASPIPSHVPRTQSPVTIPSPRNAYTSPSVTTTRSG